MRRHENNEWFWYVIQSTCGFHLCFHWISKLLHVTKLAIFYWLSTYDLLMSLRTNLLASRTFARAYLKSDPIIFQPPHTFIFNLSIHCGEIPRSWKATTVTPLYKSGSHGDPNNFRPISVLPVVRKIFERAIHKQLYDHLIKNKLLSQFQSAWGFRPGYSTSTALLDVSDYILKNIIEGNLTGAVFLGLSKAFDMIDHSLLKIKLAALGARGQALAWFDNYLSANHI